MAIQNLHRCAQTTGRRACAVLALALAAGCGPKLTFDGARVEVARATSPVDCHSIDEVDGEGRSRARAEIALRNAAGQRRANRVVVTEALENDGRVRLHGRAYGCQPLRP